MTANLAFGITRRNFLACASVAAGVGVVAPRHLFAKADVLTGPDGKLLVDAEIVTARSNLSAALASYDYRTNLPLYPEFQSFFRKNQSPTLVVWGKNDYVFPPEGAAAGISRTLRRICWIRDTSR